jgi:hypothetical protein
MDQNYENDNEESNRNIESQNTIDTSDQSTENTMVTPTSESQLATTPDENSPPNEPSPNQKPPVHNIPSRLRYLIVVLAFIVVILALYGFFVRNTGNPSNFVNNYNSSPNTGSVVTSFSEAGLPNGTRWTMSYASIGKSSTNDTILFRTAAGLYFFSVIPVDLASYNPANGSVNCFRGLYPKPSSGHLNASAVQDIIFSNTTFCGT